MSETHPKRAVAYLLIGIFFEMLGPLLLIIFMNDIIALFSIYFGFPAFTLSTNELLLVYIIVFGLIFAFIAFGRGYFKKETRSYAVFDCISSIFAIIGYIVIIGFFSGGTLGYFYFSLMGLTVEVNIYMIYVITIILYIITFIVKFAAITEAEKS